MWSRSSSMSPPARYWFSVLAPPAIETEPSPAAARLTLRPVPALRLLAWFVWQFLLSNLSVARAVLFPGRWVNTGVVHVELRSTSPTLAALVSNLTALTPGMQPVDGRPDGSALDIHVLSLRDDDTVRRVVRAGLPVIAAGGIATADDLRALRRAGAAGAVVGRAFLDGDLRVDDPFGSG